MRSLYLRIWLTVVVALALFAGVSGWLVQRHLQQERQRNEGVVAERLSAWAELLQRSLPSADAPRGEQAAALREWSMRLRVPMALDDAQGQRLATSEAFARREAEGMPVLQRALPVKLEDGRTLWVLRPGMMARPLPAQTRPPGPPGPLGWRPFPDGISLVVLLALMFVAVAAGAYPVVRRLTRRLEALERGVDAFGRGELSRRVPEDGQDEVATVAASFNRAAARIEGLLRSHQSLLANASHELRSPLARLKMAVSLLEDAAPAQRETLRREVDVNIAELDALVEEVLLASRLDAQHELDLEHPVELLGLAAEEGARIGADVQGSEIHVRGNERLLRRALRNLLENARRYGGGQVEVKVDTTPAGAQVQVCDRGPGVPDAFREKIFEPFFRLPGHAEREGGVGLGLALVRQIAVRHGGSVSCRPREGGGSVFALALPAA
jgi:signal transduction histidine kinase